MSDTVIRVENLGKKYIIGHQQQERYTVLRDVIANGAKSVGQKLLKPFGQKSFDSAYEEFWALKDVSFEINRGDRVGIIGRNGAGKSTLLKILSRITEPTKGRISIKGRVASLLEVGTGFHPELTGRENIFLNGAILGMSKAEIKKKFDEIVAFSEVEKFLDTPVKRYSSGMYVRLAFAVAAHLEPEILIVDEVLAVGDAQFQKKCLGKMEDVGKEGRTILFVSHNMSAVSQLCSQAFLLSSGNLLYSGTTQKVIESYLSTNKEVIGFWSASPENQKSKAVVNLLKAHILNSSGMNVSAVTFQETFSIQIYYQVNSINIGRWALVIRLTDSSGQHIFTSWDIDSLIEKETLKNTTYYATCSIPKAFLKPGTYAVTLGAYSLVPYLQIIEYHENAFWFEVSIVDYRLNEGRWGVITPILEWDYQEAV